MHCACIEKYKYVAPFCLYNNDNNNNNNNNFVNKLT